MPGDMCAVSCKSLEAISSNCVLKQVYILWTEPERRAHVEMVLDMWSIPTISGKGTNISYTLNHPTRFIKPIHLNKESLQSSESTPCDGVPGHEATLSSRALCPTTKERDSNYNMQYHDSTLNDSTEPDALITLFPVYLGAVVIVYSRAEGSFLTESKIY